MTPNVIGVPDLFAFEVHPAAENWQVREVRLWIGGHRLYSDVCHIPSFLQMAQRFWKRFNSRSEAWLNEVLQMAMELSDNECYEAWHNNSPPFSRLSVREVFAMHNLDEAADAYNIICLDDGEEQDRIIWSGVADHPFVPDNHRGVVFGVRVPHGHLHKVFSVLLNYFEADLSFSDLEWREWWNMRDRCDGSGGTYRESEVKAEDGREGRAWPG